MNSESDRLVDLINDPICIMLMKKDGVCHNELIKLMRSIRPLVHKIRHNDKHTIQ